MKEIQKIRNFITNIMEEWQVPGLAICIIKGKKLYFNDSFGYRNLETRLSVDSDTLFYICSVTKSFTATSVGILVDRGVLNWDTPLKQYIPEFKLQDPYTSEYVTIGDLLSHQTGVPDYSNVLFTRKIKTREEVLELLKYLNPTYKPRVKYLYNNFMYVILGYLIERLTNTTWEEFVTENILIPLEMRNTFFDGLETDKTKNISISYKEEEGRTLVFPIDYYLRGDASFMNPAGGIISCIKDIQNWVLLNLNEGEIHNKKIISLSSLRELYLPRVVIRLKVSEELSYEHSAFGWKVQIYKGNYLIRHGGHVKGYSAECNFMPQKDIGIVILCNLANVPVGQIISMYIYDVLLDQDITDWNERFKKMYKNRKENEKKLIEDRYSQRKGDTTPSHSLSDFVGVYTNECYKDIQIERDQGNLMIKIKDNYFSLKHFHYNVFEFFDNLGRRFEISFNTDFDGNISSLLMKFINSIPVIFERKREEIK